MNASRGFPDSRHAIVEVAGLRRALGNPSVATALERKPNLLRYVWPCGCRAFGLGGPNCIAKCCDRHWGRLVRMKVPAGEEYADDDRTCRSSLRRDARAAQA